MTEYLVFILPDDPENGKGSIMINEWDEVRQMPSREVLRKEFSINVQSDPRSLIEEGKIWFRKHKKEIMEELGEKGEDFDYSFG